MTIQRHVPASLKFQRAKSLPSHVSRAELAGEVGFRLYDQTVRKQNPWMTWYRLPIWKELRSAQLKAHPFCVGCGVKATVVDHREPHAGNWSMFIDRGNLQSQCGPCHSAKSHRDGSRFSERKR